MSSGMTSQNIGPTHKHDCEECTFLGHFNGHDLYHCTGQMVPTVIARWDGDGPAYASGMPIARGTPLSSIDDDDVTLRALRVAYIIAKDSGLDIGDECKICGVTDEERTRQGSPKLGIDKLCDSCWESMSRMDSFLRLPKGRAYTEERLAELRKNDA